MEQYLEQMTKAIAIRHSNRHFRQESLSSDNEQSILSFLDALSVPFVHDVKISYNKVPENASIVYFKGPSQFIALESPKSVEDQTKLGFLGELIILYAESIGIRTCWMGHYKKKQVHDIVYCNGPQESNRKIYCIILLGYIPEKTGLVDRISKRRFSKKIREIESFLLEDSLKEYPEVVRYSLSLASKAPSAMNTQKWYYSVLRNQTGYDLEIGKIKGYRHFKWPYYDIDVGTAAAHLWLGLRANDIISTVACSSDETDSSWRFSITSID